MRGAVVDCWILWLRLGGVASFTDEGGPATGAPVSGSGRDGLGGSALASAGVHRLGSAVGGVVCDWFCTVAGRALDGSGASASAASSVDDGTGAACGGVAAHYPGEGLPPGRHD